MSKIQVGSEVRYTETNKGNTHTRLGTVVDLGGGKDTGRVRVMWDRAVRQDGTTEKAKKPKRTWFQAKRLVVVEPPAPAVEERE